VVPKPAADAPSFNRGTIFCDVTVSTKVLIARNANPHIIAASSSRIQSRSAIWIASVSPVRDYPPVLAISIPESNNAVPGESAKR
jgi:hypothetical protein